MKNSDLHYNCLLCDSEFAKNIWPYTIINGLIDDSSDLSWPFCDDEALVLLEIPNIYRNQFTKKIKPLTPFPIAIYSPGQLSPKTPPNILYSGKTSASFRAITTLKSESKLVYILESGFCITANECAISFMELIKTRIGDDEDEEYLKILIDDYKSILIGVIVDKH